MFSASVVQDHRLQQSILIKGENTLRGDLFENPIEKYYDLPLPENKIIATYVWVDGTGENLRSKNLTLDYIPETPKGNFTKMIESWNNKVMEKMLSKLTYSQSEKYLPPYDYYPRNLEFTYKTECRLRTKRNMNVFDENMKDLPIISYDGFGTQQARRVDADMYLWPRAIYRDPFRHGKNLLVMCDTYNKNLEPTRTNHRVKCANAYKKCQEDEPWFGIEQEYFFLNTDDSWPFGWPKGGYPRRADVYYCGIGVDKMLARDIVNAHYRCCLFAGVLICGTNAEIGPSQWEYQVGPSVGVHAGDDVWMARFIMDTVAGEYGVQVTLDPKPFKTWDGSGAHTNFSTKKMREENGIELRKCPKGSGTRGSGPIADILERTPSGEFIRSVIASGFAVSLDPLNCYFVVSTNLIETLATFENQPIDHCVAVHSLQDNRPCCPRVYVLSGPLRIPKRTPAFALPHFIVLEIEKAIRKLAKVHMKHIKVYDPHGGKDNARRLTGSHETESISTFSAGVAERFCSIRIPRTVSENKRGFLEDRRPASNCDPYRVIDSLMRTCILNEY